MITADQVLNLIFIYTFMIYGAFFSAYQGTEILEADCFKHHALFFIHKHGFENHNSSKFNTIWLDLIFNLRNVIFFFPSEQCKIIMMSYPDI